MIAIRPTRMGVDHGTIERFVRDISANTEATPQGTPSIGAEHRAANPRIRNASENHDTIASACADASGNTDMTVLGVRRGAGEHIWKCR